MNDDAGRAGSWRRDSRIGIHEVEILSHGVNLVIEFAGEGDNFGDECLAPDRELGQVDVFAADFREVVIETDGFGIVAWSDDLDIKIRLPSNRGIEGRSVGGVFDQRDTRVIFPNE